jgi:hypothetical protein
MESPRTTPEAAPETRTRGKARERVALGLVAAYIRELSGRRDGANRVVRGNGRPAPRAAPCG